MINVTITEQIHRMPWAYTIPYSVGPGQLLASDKLVLIEILVRTEKSGSQSLTNLVVS